MNITDNKTKQNKGFTLIETTAALLLVTMLTGLLLMVSNLAKDVYADFERNSEGQILASVLTNTIQDELRYASAIVIDKSDTEDGLVIYNKGKTDEKTATGYGFTYCSESLGLGNGCRIVTLDENNKVAESGKVYVSSSTDAEALRSLAGDSAYLFDLKVAVKTYYLKNYKKFFVKLAIGTNPGFENEDDINNDTIYTEFLVDSLNENALDVVEK